MFRSATTFGTWGSQVQILPLNSITGISGSPVYDVTAHALCGMVVRGGMTENLCAILYMDISDIVRFLDAVNRGDESAYYAKLAASS